MAGKKVSKEDIKKVLDKVRRGAGAKIDKSKDRIIDKPLSEKENPPEKPKDKLDLVLEKMEGFEKRLKETGDKTDKLEQVYNRSVTQKQTKGGGSQTTGKTNQQLLDEAEREQEKAGGKQGQITQEEYQKLSAEEKVKFWEQQAQRASQGPTAEQALAQGERRQQSQTGATKAGINPQYIYLLTKTIENLGPIVQTAIAKGGGGGGEKSGESLESLGKDLVTGLLKRSIEGQIGGAAGDGTQQLQAFSNMQNLMLGGFFNTLKMLGKDQAQKMVTNIFANPNLPGAQIPSASPGERINP